MQDLSNQLPFSLKSQTSSFVLPAKNTSSSVFSWIMEESFVVKSRSLGFELSPLNTCHLRCIDIIWINRKLRLDQNVMYCEERMLIYHRKRHRNQRTLLWRETIGLPAASSKTRWSRRLRRVPLTLKTILPLTSVTAKLPSDKVIIFWTMVRSTGYGAQKCGPMMAIGFVEAW